MRPVAWIAIRALIVIAPVVLHFGTRDVSYMLGSGPFPLWTALGACGDALAAIVLAAYDFRAIRTKVTWLGWTAAVLGIALLTPLVGWLLYLVIDLLAAVLALPYTAMLVAMGMRTMRGWSAGSNR